MLTTLYRSAVVWTVIGLLGGLGYRELTRSHDFTDRTQLAVVHTHALTLGTLMMLILLGLTAALALDSQRRFRWGVWTWNAGLAITVTMLTIKGTLQVLDPAAADSKALAGISGLGHMTLTAAFALLLLAIGAQVRATTAATAASTSTHTHEPADVAR